MVPEQFSHLSSAWATLEGRSILAKLGKPIALFGASTRAAAFSALRAGLEPCCADLFADADLRAWCAVEEVAPDQYPQGFLELQRIGPPIPWMYAGGLENWPRLVHEMSEVASLWGNDAAVLAKARDPLHVAELLARAGLPHPATTVQQPRAGRWLAKPRRSAGGRGIRFEDGTISASGVYWQEYIEGLSCSALYLGERTSAWLLGATRQLVGESWLNARPFHYCGSIGPLPLERGIEDQLKVIGQILAQGCGLVGLFGVDFVLRDGVPYIVEINPRYTASVEVLEYATGESLLARQRRVFDSSCELSAETEVRQRVVGKAILFANREGRFPASGPWQVAEQPDPRSGQLPGFADIPEPGETLAPGKPVFTLFTAGSDVEGVERELQRTALAIRQQLGQ